LPQNCKNSPHQKLLGYLDIHHQSNTIKLLVEQKPAMSKTTNNAKPRYPNIHANN
jgi:hypothetical protein